MPTIKAHPPHLEWLVDTKKRLKTADGKRVEVWELRHKKRPAVLSAWAKHFRNHYCADEQIDALRKGTNLSRSEYLTKLNFPDPAVKPGPSIRSGDFGEVLIADYVEFVLGYWVPRTRYDHKATRNESTKGSDILGFKLVKEGKIDRRDALAIFEVKAALSDNSVARLQDAIDHSSKDEIRKAESLNALKQRFIDQKQELQVQTVERFQNSEDRPYAETYGAVAVACCPAVTKAEVQMVDASAHPRAANLVLLVIHGLKMMDLVNELYGRAADEA